ncbi:MAG: V-type ATP synthase subunit E [Blautia sp.]|jgi:V/A-type H+-transporting ATPase subunit E
MTGLDKIINQILDEANNSASEKLEEAKAQAEEILKTARAEADKETEEISLKSKTDMANYQDRMKSAADLKRRTAILEAKQEMIADVMGRAYQKFCSKGDTEYFETILDMLRKFALAQDGVLYFSPGDLQKLPGDFETKVQAIAKDKGGTLTISKESRNIDKGFVLAYGGIEENCSFKALFDSKKDELQDKVQAALFS